MVSRLHVKVLAEINFFNIENNKDPRQAQPTSTRRDIPSGQGIPRLEAFHAQRQRRLKAARTGLLSGW